jgi:hypothetical protein
MGSYLLEGQGRLIPILACKVVIHAKVSLAAQLVPGGTVWDALNHSALGKDGEGTVRWSNEVMVSLPIMFQELTPGAVATTR